MLNNFLAKGIDPNDIHIVCGYRNIVSDNWKKLAKTYEKVNFFFYADDRYKPSYISSIRPHILYQHWLHHPELQNETVFYHDCDIIFSNIPDFESMLKDDVCYVSDTVSYIGAKYIRSKGEHYIDLMTSIVNINKQFIIDHEKDSGGAQYLLKYIPIDFWKKVYYDAENLFRMITEQINKDKAVDPSIHELQIWCADMWAVLWNLWFFDKKVEVTDKLSFSWATSGIAEWEKHPIFHNAGVTVDRKDLFFKGAYINKNPYEDVANGVFNDKFCSIKYVEEILKTKEVTCLK